MQITGTNQSAIYHNNFIQNDSQAYQSNTGITWDNGYPSGGNYWSNYAGVDNCSGPQQNICPSPDGIGDTPPSIDGTVYQDHYPFMKPFTAQNPASPPGVTVSPPTPNPASTGSVVNVAFSVSSSSTVTGITVNWGDGTASANLAGTARSDSHVYTSTGAVKSKTFTITVTATNGAGPGSDTASETVNDERPTVTVTSISPNPVNTGTIVTASFSSTDPDGTMASVTVNWGDGSALDNLPGTATSDTHSYSSAGTFIVTVTAADNGGSTGSGTGSVAVQAPKAPIVTVNNPTPNPASTGTSITVMFTVSSSATVTGITVNWGDGSTIDSLPGTATSDTHIYASTGNMKSQTFMITVTATNSAGPGSGTTTEVVNDRPPVVTISSITPPSPFVGQSVTVSFSATDPDGSANPISLITVNWCGAGTATSDTHTYASTGSVKSQIFTITVTGTNDAGPGSGTSSETINDQPPTVTISGVSPNPANTGQLVTVSFTGSDIDGSISSIGVNWGDGTPTHSLAGTATSDTHSYTATGTFTIMIVATDNSGSTGQVTGSATFNIPTEAPYGLGVTAEGKVYRFYQNGTLTLVGQPVTTPLREVAWKPDGSYALIVGDFATLVKYDGTSLTTVPTGISTGFNFWSVSWKQDGSYALI